MPESIEFDLLHQYSLVAEGITVPFKLQYGSLITTFDAKVDTGSTYCVFERGNGEALGIEIEKVLPILMGTATGTFKAFGHELTFQFSESKQFPPSILPKAIILTAMF